MFAILELKFAIDALLQLLETYLQFVGIGITNAQIVEISRQEYDRNRVSGSLELLTSLYSIENVR